MSHKTELLFYKLWDFTHAHSSLSGENTVGRSLEEVKPMQFSIKRDRTGIRQRKREGETERERVRQRERG